jgi:hypothetical protein
VSPGTASTAASRAGSNATTDAAIGFELPGTSTLTLRVPETTCAFVSTCPGAITAPLP